jgi:NTE family protein
VPGPLRAALALADIPINRNSSTALAAQRNLIEGFRTEVAAAHARGDFEVFAPDARFYLIEVNLGDEPDPALRERLLAIPTTLELPAEDVALLRRHAAAALLRSADFRRLLDRPASGGAGPASRRVGDRSPAAPAAAAPARPRAHRPAAWPGLG